MSDDDSKSRSFIARLARALSGRGEAGDQPADGETPSDQHDLLLNAQAFDQLRVADVMVPRADIVAVDIDTPLGELASRFAEAAHSRLPIFRETLDDPVGVAHIKDVMAHIAGNGAPQHSAAWTEARILPDVRRPLLYAPPSMRAIDLLLKMQSRRMHMALVVDEFGGTDGLVTLEDLLEPIVGDIEDEHDEDEPPAIRAKGPACWDADARAPIEDFEETVGREIATDEEEEDVDTLGGLVFMLAGRIPERGEVIRHSSGFEFEVLDSDPRRIKRLRVRSAASLESAVEAGA
ncbi:magnesium/cobalt efflux protein [Marinicauda salina]|uniref:Magnesium/cobalt efflux protein n=1 Tax=Marinicauda salina TaxID=2135793 RepID=A0A2U2BWC7_9PROT|nr:hemolysin family protein [Marinicauda salina]PWE18325.1 magnesium/cobalt efflux protein [Marinicauda salina]